MRDDHKCSFFARLPPEFKAEGPGNFNGRGWLGVEGWRRGALVAEASSELRQGPAFATPET